MITDNSLDATNASLTYLGYTLSSLKTLMAFSDGSALVQPIYHHYVPVRPIRFDPLGQAVITSCSCIHDRAPIDDMLRAGIRRDCNSILAIDGANQSAIVVNLSTGELKTVILVKLEKHQDKLYPLPAQVRSFLYFLFDKTYLNFLEIRIK